MSKSFTLTVRQAQSKSNSSQGFTLIELLIVIAIVAILSVVVILALNPGELLKQARDSSRLSDLNSLHKALSLYQVDNPAGSFGTASTTYISYPDSSASCANIGISTSTIANGYSFACAASSTYTKIDGTGWVPANLSSITGGAPISQLPRDPVNTTSSNNYYVYHGNTSNWALASLLESSKYLSQSGQKDGGYDPGRFEKGSDLALISQGEGLVGWWTMDEGSGSTAADSSGYGNMGTLTNEPTWTTGKVGQAVQMDGTNDYITLGAPTSLNLTGPFTVMAWVKRDSLSDWARIGGKYYYSGGSSGSWEIDGGQGYLRCYVKAGGVWSGADAPAGTFNQTSTWYMVGCVYNGSRILTYINGTQQSSNWASGTVATSSYPTSIGTTSDGVSAQNYMNGAFDEFRIYNRALSAAEIAAIYNAAR